MRTDWKRDEKMDEISYKMERKDRTRGQIRLLHNFYKELITWEVESIGTWMVAGLLLFAETPLFCIPWQEYGGEQLDKMMGYMIVLLGCMGTFLYMRPYLYMREFSGGDNVQRRQVRVVERLRYLPVDKKSILFFLWRKLFRLLLILGGIWLAMQCLVAGISCGGLTIGNFLYPISAGMLLPAVVNGIAVAAEVWGM